MCFAITTAGIGICRLKTTIRDEDEVKNIVIENIEARIPGKVLSITVTQIPDEQQESVKVASCLSAELANLEINSN